MAKINKTVQKTFGDVLKQRKLEKIMIAKEKEAQIKAERELRTDKFIKNTAKEMLKNSAKYQLQVFNADSTPNFSTLCSERSVWAPWSKLFGN